MSQTDPHTLDSVEKLLVERRKIAGWLSALGDRRTDTSPAVHQRVHDDYTAKLDKVQAKLVAASDAVQLVATDVAGRLVDKEQVLIAKLEERAEAELRAAVGEYSEREWEKRRTKLDDEIVAATSERDALRDELARLRSVLGEVAGAAVSGRGTLDAAGPLAAVPEPVAHEPGAAEPVVPGPVAPEAEAPEPEAAEVAGAALVPESTTVAAGPPAIEIQEQSIIAPIEPAKSLEPSFDELAFLKTVVGRPTPLGTSRVTVEAAPRAGAAEPPRASKGSYTVPEPPLEFPDAMPEPRVSQEMTPPRESYFGRPTPRSSEAVKSLKCQECGTLNFPTEWYCERCGGELAAM